MPELLITTLTVVLLFAVKVGGYTLALQVGIPRAFPGVPPRALAVAVLRTVLGGLGAAVLVALGALTANLLSGSDATSGNLLGMALTFGGQLVLRTVIWLGLVALFYDRRLTRPARVLGAALAGVFLSYLLDVPEYLLAWADLAFVFRDFRMC